MPLDPLEIWMWQRARDLFEHAERVHRNLLQRSFGQTASWVPPVNVVETEDSLWIVCALPGISEDELELRLEESELVILGRRRPLECCIHGQVRTLEIPFGRFERRVELPLQPLSLAENHYENGLVFVRLKKL